jgi:hypothetical protein
MMKKTNCDGCGAGDYGKDYIYSVCVTCGEEVCGWCSYDVVRENGQLCIRCGFKVTTREEVEEIAKMMKCDPHTYTYTPTAKPKKKKVVLKIVKRVPVQEPKPDLIASVIAEQAKLFSFERKYQLYMERMEKGICEKCGLTGIRLFKTVGNDADGFPEHLCCADCE